MQSKYTDIFITLDNQLLDASDKPIVESDIYKRSDLRVWVPSERVTLLEIALPTRNSLEIEQSLPYAAEDELLDDVENLHFAWNSTAKNKPLQVAVVSHQHMRSWINLLQPYKLSSLQLIPDIFCLPWQDKKPTVVYLDNDRAILRTGLFSGFASTHKTIDIYINNEHINPKVFHFYAQKKLTNSITKKTKKGDRTTTKSPIQSNIHNEIENSKLPLNMHVSGASHQYINLLQGDYIAGATFTRVLRRSIGAIIGIAAMTILIFSHQLVQYFTLTSEVRNFQKIVEERANEIVPGYKYGQPLQLLVERQLENQRQQVAQIQYTPWSIFEQTIPLLRNCHNCVFENITIERQTIRIKLTSFNPLGLIQKQINSIEEYTVSTDLRTTMRDKYNYSELLFTIDIGK